MQQYVCLWWPSRLLFVGQGWFFLTLLEVEYQDSDLNMNLTKSESLPKRFVPFCCYYESQDSILSPHHSPSQLKMVCSARNRWKGAQPCWRALSAGDGVIEGSILRQQKNKLKKKQDQSTVMAWSTKQRERQFSQSWQLPWCFLSFGRDWQQQHTIGGYFCCLTLSKSM